MRQLFVWIFYPMISFPAFGAHQKLLKDFSLPESFQVIQVIDNFSWQNRPVRMVLFESELNLLQLTEMLAEKIPAGSLLTKSRSALQFNWVDSNNSNLLELTAVSEHLVRGMFSSIRLEKIESAICGDKNHLSVLLPAQTSKLFRFVDESVLDQHVEFTAYRTRLSPAQVAVHFSKQMNQSHWTVLTRYSETSYLNAWSAIEAISNQQRLRILIHPDPAVTGFLITRTTSCN